MADARLQVEVEADGVGFFNTMNRIDARVTTFAKGLHSLKGQIGTVFGAYAIGNFAKSVIDMADSITEMSNRLGVSAEWLQRFQHAARMSGVDIGSMANAIENLNAARGEVLSGSSRGQKLFATGSNLGLGMSDWGMRSQDIMMAMSRAIQQGDPQALSPALQEIVGKPFRELMTVMRSDMEATMATARVMTDENRQALADARDRWDALTQVLKVLASGPLAKLIEVFSKATVFFSAMTAFLGNTVFKWSRTLIDFNLSIMGGNIPRALGILKGVNPMGDLQGGLKAFDDTFSKLDKMIVQGSNKSAGGALPFGATATPADWSKAGIKSTPQRNDVGGDELIKVGNFLGANRSSVTTLWEEQIRIANKQAFIQAAMLEQFHLLNKAFAAMGMGPNVIGIPPVT